MEDIHSLKMKVFPVIIMILISSVSYIFVENASKNILELSDINATFQTNETVPYILPPGVSSPWHNDSPEFFELEYDGNLLNPVNYSIISQGFKNFNVLRLRLPTNNNQVVDLFIEESPNQENCRTWNNRYSGNLNMYLLRTDGLNQSGEANGYIIESLVGVNWTFTLQIYGEWNNNSISNSWRINIEGNSGNNSIKIQDIGISNNRGIVQHLNNTIPKFNGYNNGHEQIVQLHYRLIRFEILYESYHAREMCQALLQTENILRNQLKVQLFVERFTHIGLVNNSVFNDPEDAPCGNESLIQSIREYKNRSYNKWIPPTYPNGLRGMLQNNQSVEIDALFYFGLINDTFIDFRSKLFNSHGEAKKLGCAIGPSPSFPLEGLGIGWALMDHHPSYQWNSVNLFTQLLTKSIGGAYSKSIKGYSMGLTQNKYCNGNETSAIQFHSIMVPSYNNITIKHNNGSTISHYYPVPEDCYGIIPLYSSEVQLLVNRTTINVPFLHIQPDWSKHWMFRWSFFGDFRLRIWYIQSFNALSNDSFYGISGAPAVQSTPAGPDPIWRIRWLVERYQWIIPVWNQTSYWSNDIVIDNWFNGVRADINLTNLNYDNWLNYCSRGNNWTLNLSFIHQLQYVNGWSNSNSFQNTITGLYRWNIKSCHPGAILSGSTNNYSPMPKFSNSPLGGFYWIAFPSIQTNSLPWITNGYIEYSHIALMWNQLN